jgi:hypothetical protein
MSSVCIYSVSSVVKNPSLHQNNPNVFNTLRSALSEILEKMSNS